MATGDRAAYLLAEEYLAAGDERFLAQLRTLHDPKRLVPIIEKWKRDHRPWARRQIIDYLRALDIAGHEPVVKRLFKHAEEKQDDVLMAHFMCAFDGLIRRKRRRKYHYDWQTRQSWDEEALMTPRRRGVAAIAPGATLSGGERRQQKNPPTLFSRHTQHYLRRRAWRYFRSIAFNQRGRRAESDYTAAVSIALRLYTNADLAAGENLLDSWGLIHAMFGGSDVLEFGSAFVNPRPGRGLSELTAAPKYEQLWKAPSAIKPLLTLVADAASRPVRVWATQLVRAYHLKNLTAIDVALLLLLLDHADEEVQQLGAELLENATTLDRLSIADWLRLLQTRNMTALESVVRAMRKNIAPDRLELEQLIDIATAEPVPVARLGLEFLQARNIAAADDRNALTRLADAKSMGVGGEIAKWALGILGTREQYDVKLVSPFFDSANFAIRVAAFAWLTPESAGHDDPALYSRLLETPYDDVRFALVADLKSRAALAGAGGASLVPLWSSVLLGIHRGGRSKLIALRQISDAVARDPQNAAALMPVLAVAIRSVRPPEARTGLSAIVGAVERSPALADDVARFLPELQLPVGADWGEAIA